MKTRFLYILMFTLFFTQKMYAQKAHYEIIFDYMPISNDSIAIILNNDTIFHGRHPNNFTGIKVFKIPKNKIIKNNQLEIIFFTFSQRKTEITKYITFENKHIYNNKVVKFNVSRRVFKKNNLFLIGVSNNQIHFNFTKKKFAPSEG